MQVKLGIAALAVAAIAVTGCSSSKSSGGSTGTDKSQASASTNDINAVAYDQVPSGGTMRWPITGFPVNFNINQLDGNDSDTVDLMNATLPMTWNYDAGGKPILNTVVVDKAQQTSTSPQTIEYHINPKAVWSDGTPITYKDFAAMWKSLNGVDTKYIVPSTTGYDRIASVDKGATDQDVKVVFKSSYGEWQSLFSPIMPASLNATADSFNKAWVNGPALSGGPFKVGSIDKTAKTVTLVHNDKW
jgi:peptide/nickel transport system substrate-binding protein